MAAHSAKSPSQAKRIRTCHGSLTLCAALPEFQRNQSGEAARLGTVTHSLIEHALRQCVEPEVFRDRIVELEGDDEEPVFLTRGSKMPGRGRVFYIVDSDMIDAASRMTRYVRRRCKELGISQSDLQLETRTNPLPDRDDTDGTADVTIDAWPTMLEVVDYKNGYRYVDEASDQVIAYLLGKALEADMSHEKYRVTIVQPNIGDGKPRHHDMTKAQLLAWQKAYRVDIEKNDEAADDPNAPTAGFKKVNPKWAAKYLNAGNDADHCTFCDAAPICPARLMMAQNDAAIDFADDPEELPEPTTEEEAARILAWAPRMETLIRATSAYALRAIQNGYSVPGQKAVRGKTNRKLVDMDESKLVASIVNGKWITDRAKLYSKPALLSGPQMEKLVTPKRRKAFSDKFMVKPEGALTLAPDDDPREAVICNPGDDFDSDLEDFG